MAVALEFADRRVRIDGPAGVDEATTATLRNHVADAAGDDLRFVLRALPDRDREWLDRERTGECEWRIAYSERALDEVPNRFYYLVLLPTMKAVLAELGVACFHGAFVRTPGGVYALLLGDAGAGKTTTAASCALAGGALLSDDIVLWSEASRQWYGLRRPLHIDPKSFSWLAALPGLDEATPYLPNRSKVAYDWWRHQPGEPFTSADHVDLLVPSSIAAKGVSSRTTLMTSSAPGEVLRGALEAPIADDARRCADAAGDACVIAIEWAPDVFDRPSGPVSLLERAHRH